MDYTKKINADDDIDDDFRDNIPSPLAVASLGAAFLCPFLLPLAAAVIGLDAQKRTVRSKTRKVAKKLEEHDEETRSILLNTKNRGSLNGAKMTHTFDFGSSGALINRYTTGYVTKDIDPETGRIKTKFGVL